MSPLLRTRFGRGLLLAMLLSVALSAPTLRAQGTAGTGAGAEPRSIITQPTAGLLLRGQYSAEVQLFPGDGLRAGLQVGLWNRILLGIAYGGTDLIGATDPTWQGVPGATLRVRVLDESLRLPALVLGFDAQGTGLYRADRFAIKSPGAFLALSKNYQLLGFLAVHGGASYSLEPDSDHVNGYVGLEKTVGPIVSLVAEYNLATNDARRRFRALDTGDLNLAARLSIGALTVELAVLSLGDHRTHLPGGSRLLRLEYVAGF